MTHFELSSLWSLGAPSPRVPQRPADPGCGYRDRVIIVRFNAAIAVVDRGKSSSNCQYVEAKMPHWMKAHVSPQSGFFRRMGAR